MVMIVLMLMMMLMLVASAVAMLIMLMVMIVLMLMMMLVIVAAAIAMLVMLMVMIVLMLMMMLVIVAAAIAMLVMLMVMLVLMMVLMIVAAAVAVFVMLMMMFVLMVMVLVTVTAAVAVLIVVMMMVVSDLVHQLMSQIVTAFHSGQDLRSGELIPGGGENSGFFIVFPQQMYDGVQLDLVHVLGAGEQDGAGMLYLIVKELTKVLHIDLALHGIHYGDKAVQSQGGAIVLYALYRGNHVGQFAHAGGLNDNAVGGIGVQNFLQGGAEVTHQGTADAAGVHFGDLHAGFLEETAVNANLTEFVFDQDDLFALKCLLKQFFDQSGLAGTQKAGDNVDLCHVNRSFHHIIRAKVPWSGSTVDTAGRQPRRG